MIANEDDNYDSKKKQVNCRAPVLRLFLAGSPLAAAEALYPLFVRLFMFAGHCLHKKSRQVILMRENKFEKVYKFGAAYPVHNMSIEFYSLICNYYIVKNLTHMSGGGGGGGLLRKS